MRNTSKSAEFSYFLRSLKSLFTLDGFATSSLTTQGLLVLLSGFLVVYGFAPILGSLKLSAQLFMQTSGVDALETWPELVFGTIEFFIGLVIFSLVITLSANALTQFVGNVKEGTLNFKYSHHIVIINGNDMLIEVLHEINARAIQFQEVYRVVILGENTAAVNKLWKELLDQTFVNLEIFVRQGDLYKCETYKRINLCKATGALLLQDYEEKDKFDRDNNTLKALLALEGWPDFRDALRARQKALTPFKFVAETSGTLGCQQIISKLAPTGGAYPFIGVSPLEVTDNLLGRAIADSRYYAIFEYIFSFEGHEIFFLDPNRYGANVEGQVFRDICYGFTQGVIIGRSRFQNGSFDIQIGPMDEVLKAGDWLIVLAEDQKNLTYDASKRFTFPIDKLHPKEIVFRRICMIGDKNSFPSLTGFLDEESRKIFKENQLVFKDINQYFEPELFNKIREKNFDTIVINLEDEVSVRLAAYVHTLFPVNDPFLDKIGIVIEDTISDELLNPNSKKHNTILSRRLCAKYLTQILFQRSLVAVIDELCSPEGYEINLIEVGKDIPKDKLGTNKDETKRLLLGSNMIYLGFFDHQDQLAFDSNDLEKAKTLIVLAKCDS